MLLIKYHVLRCSNGECIFFPSCVLSYIMCNMSDSGEFF